MTYTNIVFVECIVNFYILNNFYPGETLNIIKIELIANVLCKHIFCRVYSKFLYTYMLL